MLLCVRAKEEEKEKGNRKKGKKEKRKKGKKEKGKRKKEKGKRKEKERRKVPSSSIDLVCNSVFRSSFLVPLCCRTQV